MTEVVKAADGQQHGVGARQDMKPDSDSAISKLRRRAQYKVLATAVGQAINQADPIGLFAVGCPDDEYSPEIGTIIPRVSKASNSDEVRRILHEEFVHWFGPATAGPEHVYEIPALQIWKAVTQYRQAG